MSPRRGCRPVAAAAGLALGLALAACTPAADEPPASGLPDGVTVEFQQGRSDVAARQAQVVVTNDTDDALTVAAVEVDDARFADPAVRVEDRESRIAPGTTVGIRVQLADVACDEPDAVGAAPTVTMDYVLGDEPGRATAPIPDPLGFVAPLHERDCRAAAVERAAHLTLADFDPSEAGEPAQLTLGVAPTGRGTATISGIQTTNLLTFGDAPDATVETYPIGLEVDEQSAGFVEIVLPLVPLRCDAHAVQEDKRGTIFDVDVELDGDAGEIELAASEDLRGEILTWVAQWCGFGG